MTHLVLDEQVWPLDRTATLGQTRPDQMPSDTQRAYRLTLPINEALPLIEPMLADLAEDLRADGTSDFDAELEWLALGLVDAAALWMQAPALLARLLSELGLTRNLLENLLLRRVDRALPPTAWLDPEAEVRSAPGALVIEGHAWVRPGPSAAD